MNGSVWWEWVEGEDQVTMKMSLQGMLENIFIIHFFLSSGKKYAKERQIIQVFVCEWIVR